MWHVIIEWTLEDLKELFIKFINKVPSFGKSFICLDDKNNKNILSKLKMKNYYTYGIDPKSHFAWTGGTQKILDKGRVSKYNKKFSNLRPKK